MNVRVFIIGMGIISPLGAGFSETLAALKKGRTGITPLSLFPTSHQKPLPVGEIGDVPHHEHLPRTHVLAKIAAQEAMRRTKEKPDAIVMGVITGGMPVTEELLMRGIYDPQRGSMIRSDTKITQRVLLLNMLPVRSAVRVLF